MAIGFLLGRKEPGRIGDLILDATVNESHEYANAVSAFPVETGADISDHVRREPERITVDGFVTNSPVQFLGGTIGRFLGINSGDRVRESFTELMRISGYDYPNQPATLTAAPNTPLIVDVVTGLRVYSDMIMTRLSIQRNSRTGESLRFTAELQRIRFTNSQFIQITNTSELQGREPRINDQGASKVEAGTQTPIVIEQSRAKAAFDKINGLLARGF